MTAATVACGISGGVDSAVAAYLLKRFGYKVTGVFMRNWDLVDEFTKCTLDEDLADAKLACQKLDIPLVETNFAKDYWNYVFDDLVTGYAAGITPNPDILCNRFIKFDKFVRFSKKLGADFIATGHYADRSPTDPNPDIETSLLSPKDLIKDQTFFLSQIGQSSLRISLFPLSRLKKTSVKKIARKIGLSRLADKKESMGVCFIGKREFRSFIEHYIPPSPGQFIDYDTGRILGKHEGVHYFTIGQRAPVSVNRTAYFIQHKDATSKTITLVKGHNHPALFSFSFRTKMPRWIRQAPADLSMHKQFKCDFRFQHIDPLTQCFIRLNPDGGLSVRLSKPMWALTPGQYAVFYSGRECLGSAPILEIGPSLHKLARSGL